MAAANKLRVSVARPPCIYKILQSQCMHFLNLPQSSCAFTSNSGTILDLKLEIEVLATGPQLKTSTRLGDLKLTRLCFSILVVLCDLSGFKVAASSISVANIESCIAVNARFGLLIDATIVLLNY